MTVCRKLLLTVLVGLFGMLANAQQAPSAITFDGATIKPTARTDGSWRLNPTPDGYDGMDISLLYLIRTAYGVWDADRMVGGPAWIDKDKFNLQAKFDPSAIPAAYKLTRRQREEMLQPLLAERFHLKVHHETRTFPVFKLVIAKDGPKLTETTAVTAHDYMGSPTCLHTMKGAENCTTDDIALELRYSGRTVINMTGLTGRYNFKVLRYSTPNTPIDSPDSSLPSIFTVVQDQLGLKLEPSTAPLDVLVIDSAERPTAN